MLRIIGGKLRGRKLKVPKGLETRPVLGRVREALFNVLSDVRDFEVLDLYAGTGAIGIEALSRGAAHAVFVDSGPRQCRTISENLGAAGVSGEIIRSDVLRAIGTLGGKGRSFDFVFADPPWEQGLGPATVDAVFEAGIVTAQGTMGLTVRRTDEVPERFPGCECIFDRRYGDSRLLLFSGARAGHELETNGKPDSRA